MTTNDLLYKKYQEYLKAKDKAFKEGYQGYPHFHTSKYFGEWLDKHDEELLEKYINSIKK